MKKRINISSKRSQSGIITAILLIIIVIVSVVVVWNVIYAVLKKANTGSSATDMLTTQLDIPKSTLFITGGAQVLVHRLSGGGNITSLNFIFTNKNGETKIVSKTSIPAELETKAIDFSSSEIPYSNSDIAKISVVPVIGSSPGMTFDESTSAVTKDSTGNRVLEINSSSAIISWWKLDGNYLDSVGTNSGTCTSPNCPAPITDRHGNANSAMSFTTATNSIDVGNSPSISFTNQYFTFSLWVYLTAGTNGATNYYLFNKEMYNLGGYECRIEGSDLSISCRTSGGTILSKTTNSGTNKVSQNIWTHIVITKINSANIFIYINGIDKTGNKNDQVDPGPYSGDLTISGRGSEGFIGTIDDVMVFNKSLSADEVLGLYNNQK